MSVRLNKVTKEFNIGLQTAVEFLQKKGYSEVEANPNYKISDEEFSLLQQEFSSDKGLRTEAKMLIQQRQEQTKERKKSAPVEEFVDDKPSIQGPKILGKIELDKKKAAPAEEEQEEEVKEQEETPVAEPETPVEQETPAEPVAPAEPETPAEPEVEEKSVSEPVEEAPVAEVAQEETPAPQKPEVGVEENGVFRLAPAPQPGPGLTVKGKIDLDSLNQSTRPKKKSKEEKRRERDEKRAQQQQQQQAAQGERKKRLRVGKERVDVNAVANQPQNFQKNNNNNQGQQNGGGKKKNKQKQQAFLQPEVSEEEVAKQVRETLARLTNKNNKMGKGAKYRREKRDAIRQGMEEQLENEAAESKVLKLTEFVTANELATMMNVPVTQVIGTCMQIGIMVSINQRMDAETINLVAEEFGFTTEYVSAEVSEAVTEVEDAEEDLVPRAPIVTVMGHVDHGKTSLLDYIRKTNVIAGEAGGITQHIGAYNVTLPDGRHVTFLDTPGHEAFTAMRARGAQVTDIAIIIVAADDSVMPTTKEAIAHAQAANVPMVFAINKIDKPGANPDKIREDLANMNLLVEEWGGKYQCQEISAKKGIGVDELLEKVLLEAEMLDLKANPNRKATGSIIESSLDKGRGYVSTVLVSNGTLKVGDVVIAGTAWGKVKAMFNERNQRIEKAGPAEPAIILGLNGAPTAGDSFHVMESEQEAREIANKRIQLQREQSLLSSWV